MNIKRFKQSQRFRIIIGVSCFYSTAKQIRNGVGDFTRCNAAVQKALDSLEYTRSQGGALSTACGQAGIWEGLNVQIDVA